MQIQSRYTRAVSRSKILAFVVFFRRWFGCEMDMPASLFAPVVLSFQFNHAAF